MLTLFWGGLVEMFSTPAYLCGMFFCSGAEFCLDLTFTPLFLFIKFTVDFWLKIRLTHSWVIYIHKHTWITYFTEKLTFGLTMSKYQVSEGMSGSGRSGFRSWTL